MTKAIARHGLASHFELAGQPCNLIYQTKDENGNPSQAFRTLFLQELIRGGVLAPSFVISFSHTDQDIDRTVDVVDQALRVYALALQDGVRHHLLAALAKSPSTVRSFSTHISLISALPLSGGMALDSPVSIGFRSKVLYMAAYTATDPQATSTRKSRLRPAFVFQSNIARTGKYRADIDGLRAIAVLAVVFFHTKLFQCAGGYVGVDVFFVISGYLITSLIARDIAEGRFSFVAFYERRIRRIFPALFAVLFFSAAAGFVLLAPQDLASFGKSLVATTLFLSNVHFWHVAQPLGYFSNKSVSEALLHTWSLAVEEQFYLVFPVVLIVLFRWAAKWTNASLLLLSATSFGLNVWCTYHRPIAAFYFAAPRAWELLIGALLANHAVPPLRHRGTREVAAGMGLGLILTAIFVLSETTSFPGFSVLLPCLGAWLVIYAGESGPSATKILLSLRPLVFIGAISYSLYLWHWPLLVFGRYFVAGELSTAETALVLNRFRDHLAFLSFEFIVMPFPWQVIPITRLQVFLFALAASLISASFGMAVWITRGLPQRYCAQSRQIIAANTDRESNYDNSCANWRTQIHSLSDIRLRGTNRARRRKLCFGETRMSSSYTPP